MKKCPYCAEEIQEAAVKCKHCGSLLNQGLEVADKRNKARIIKVLTFETTATGQKYMAKKIVEMEKDGWKEINRVSEVGKYKSGMGCLLFFILAPLALLAGHNKDKVRVTFEKYVIVDEKNRVEHNANIKKFFKYLLIFALIIMGIVYWYIGIPVLAIWYIWKKTKIDDKKKTILTLIIFVLTITVWIIMGYQARKPKIEIVSPDNNYSIQADGMAIKGKVDPSQSQIKVNGELVTLNVEKNGDFTYMAKLTDEQNNFVFIAINHNKTSEATITINRFFTEEEKAAIAKQKVIDEAKRQADLIAQQKAEAERKAIELAAQQAWEQSKAGKLCAEYPSWTKEECQNVADRKYWIGMTYDMLVESYGSKPNHANPSNYGSGTSWQWCWSNYNPSCFYDDNGDSIIDSYN